MRVHASPSSAGNLETVFKKMDENGDGVISKEEWLQAHGGHASNEKSDSGSIDRAIAR